MRVTEKTKYADFVGIEPYIAQSAVVELKKAAERVYGGMYDLPFAIFYNCANGDFSNLGDLSNPTVLQVYWCKRFADFSEDFAKSLKKYTLPQTNDEMLASNNLIEVNWAEGILVFLQKYFNLKSFKEAEQITIGEVLIAKRAQYNQDKFRRNLSNIQSRRLKSKK